MENACVRVIGRGISIPALCFVVCSCSLLQTAPALARPTSDSGLVPLQGHIPAVVRTSQAVGWVDPNESIKLTFVLPFRNQPALDELVRKLYDPRDPIYDNYLTTEQFVSSF